MRLHVGLLAVISSAILASQALAAPPQRPKPEKAAKLEVDISTLTKGPLKVRAADEHPNQMYLSTSNHCTSFDLAYDGRMNYVMEGAVLVYPLYRLSDVGNLKVYQEISSDGWYWLFDDQGAIYVYIPGSGFFVFDPQAEILDRYPQ